MPSLFLLSNHVATLTQRSNLSLPLFPLFAFIVSFQDCISLQKVFLPISLNTLEMVWK